MTIHPAGAGPAPKPEPSRSQAAASPPPATEAGIPEPRKGDAVADGVELSSAAQALHARAEADLPPVNQLPVERLRQILRRLAEGHYDRPDVQRLVAERMLDALDRGEW